VNPDVDGYSNTLNHRKILLKTQKSNNSLNSKRILKPKYKLSEGPVFKYDLPGVAVRSSALSSLTPVVNPVCSPLKEHTFFARLLFDETVAWSDAFAVVNSVIML